MASLHTVEDIRRVQTPAEEQAAMAREVRAGLAARPLPSLPSKYFYDEQGGALFDEITRLPEYYLTRTEEALLPAVARETVERVRPCSTSATARSRIRCRSSDRSGRDSRLPASSGTS